MAAANGWNGTCGSLFEPPLAPPPVPSPPPSGASARPPPRPPRPWAMRRSMAVVPSASTTRSPMLVMYGTLHTPFSPGTRPRFGVPSASRGVGSGGPDGPRAPPRPHQAVRTAHLEAPVHRLAIRLRHVDVKVGVRIHPFDFGDGAFQIDGRTGIELGSERMVGYGRSGAEDEPHDSDKRSELRPHRRPPCRYRIQPLAELHVFLKRSL